MTNKRPENQNPEVQAGLAAAEQAALEKAIKLGGLPSLAHLTLDDLIMNNSQGEIVKGNQRASGGWIYGPALLELFQAAAQRLAKIAQQRGLGSGMVTHVRACLIRGTKIVLMWPVKDTDPEAIELKRYNSTTYVNLITLLAENKLTITTGYRQRFAIHFAPSDGPMGPCLMLDLSKPLERRKDAPQKPAESTDANATAAQKPRTAGKGKQQAAPADPPTGEATAKPAADAASSPVADSSTPPA